MFLGYLLREAVVRNVSESTNARVVWSSFMSLGVCIAVSVLQLWHGGAVSLEGGGDGGDCTEDDG